MTASRGARAAKTAPRVEDLSCRCSAEVCFPAAPYLHLRCLALPGHEGQHNASTTAPTSHGARSQMVTVDLIWWQS